MVISDTTIGSRALVQIAALADKEGSEEDVNKQLLIHFY